MTHHSASPVLLAGSTAAFATVTVHRFPVGADFDDLPAPQVMCSVMRLPASANPHPYLDLPPDLGDAEAPGPLRDTVAQIKLIRGFHAGSSLSLDLLHDLKLDVAALLAETRKDQPCPQRCPTLWQGWAEKVRGLHAALRLVRRTIPLAAAALKPEVGDRRAAA